MKRAYILSGNLLSSGRPVYLDESGEWQEAFGHAKLFTSSKDADARLNAARQAEHILCDPFVLKVQAPEGQAIPLGQKWSIRAEGGNPILHQFGYPSLGEPGAEQVNPLKED